jgi:hypothetical protein
MVEAQRKIFRASGGRGGLNVRIGLTSAQTLGPRRSTCANQRHPNSCRAAGALGPGLGCPGEGPPSEAASGKGPGEDGSAGIFTCDGPGPAVELHGVVERCGHHVQDTTRLRVQEPHRGDQRAQAVAEEKWRPRGRGDLGGGGRVASGGRGPY